MNRAGDANEAMAGDQLVTMIGPGDGMFAKSLQRTQAQAAVYTKDDKTNKKLGPAFGMISQFLEVLGVTGVPGLKQEAQKGLRYLHENQHIGNTPSEEEIAAVIFVAGKAAAAALTLAKICAGLGLKKKRFQTALSHVQQGLQTSSLDKEAMKLHQANQLVEQWEALKQQTRNRNEELLRASNAIKSEEPNRYYGVPAARRKKKPIGPTPEEIKAAEKKTKEDFQAEAQAKLLQESRDKIAQASSTPAADGEDVDDYQFYAPRSKEEEEIIITITDHAKNFIAKWLQKELSRDVPYWIKGVCDDLLDVFNETYVFGAKRAAFIASATLWIAMTLCGIGVSVEEHHGWGLTDMAIGRFHSVMMVV